AAGGADPAPLAPEALQTAAYCPVCAEQMPRTRFAEIQLDVCGGHGAWFDRGELGRVCDETSRERGTSDGSWKQERRIHARGALSDAPRPPSIEEAFGEEPPRPKRLPPAREPSSRRRRRGLFTLLVGAVAIVAAGAAMVALPRRFGNFIVMV